MKQYIEIERINKTMTNNTVENTKEIRNHKRLESC